MPEPGFISKETTAGIRLDSGLESLSDDDEVRTMI